MHEKILLGLTGSFGSGCSTLRKILVEYYEFDSFKLSYEVRVEARRKGLDENDRDILQSIGNELRREHDNNYLTTKAIERATTEANKDRIVFHGIRNVGEINEFRKYPNFYLVAVDCSQDNRWERLKDFYDNDKRLFVKNDERDKNEGLPYGQQVLRCVEEADILFVNNENFETEIKIKDTLKKRFWTHLGLITGEELRNPSIKETMMTAASTLALQSHCIKRRVGSVLCDGDGYIVSAAYNEVPTKQKKCIEEYRMCYRDHIRNKFNKEFVGNLDYCPKCSIPPNINNSYLCSGCKYDLSELLPAYKALDKCRSLHAEETTVLKATHYQIKDSVLYSTTFPCMQCAKRILQLKIDRVVYIDPYPEEESIIMLEKGGVKTVKFEGIKAQAYYKLFYRVQETMEQKTEQAILSTQQGE